jgi:hypothetical protein
LRQADAVIVMDNKGPRAVLAVADKVEITDAGHLKAIAYAKCATVQVDDEQSDEQADESDQQIEELRALVEETKRPWRYFGNLQDADKEPRFMFVNRGVAWGAESADEQCLVVARTRKVAEQYVAWMQEHQGIKLAIADIQAVARKSFEAVIMECYRDGASRYLVIQWVGREGVKLGIAPLDSILHEVDGSLGRHRVAEIHGHLRRRPVDDPRGRE